MTTAPTTASGRLHGERSLPEPVIDSSRRHRPRVGGPGTTAELGRALIEIRILGSMTP